MPPPAARLLEHTLTESQGPATGPRQTVVLVHGFPDSPTVWAATVAHLQAKGQRVVCVALPGFERGLQDTTQHSFDDVVARLWATLVETDAVGATLVGHDWGAILLYRLIEQHPDAAGRLVALEIGAAPRTLFMTLFVLCYHAVLVATHALGGRLGDRLMRTLCRAVPRPRYPEALVPTAHHGWLYWQAWREGANPGPWLGYFRNAIAAWTPPANLPVLFLYGTGGLAALRFHTAAWRTAVTEACSQSQAVGLPGRHWFFLEHPDRFHAVLSDFLAETAEPGG